MQSVNKANIASRKGLWIGRSISTIMALFLVFDGVTKVARESHVMLAAARLGLSDEAVVAIGAILLACTAIYVVPRTSVLGAILLTGYLGGAVATQVRAGSSLFETLFPVIFGVLVWVGIFLRNAPLRALIPFQASTRADFSASLRPASDGYTEEARLAY
ncbi:MAG TPA: DoxX family protein [Bryobacteraceae bacterium]|nr:DoxX family protein [Bryobacteraceae bacterium]